MTWPFVRSSLTGLPAKKSMSSLTNCGSASSRPGAMIAQSVERSSRAIFADLHGEINWTIQHHSTAKGEHGSHAQERPAVCNAVRWVFTFTGCSNRGGLIDQFFNFSERQLARVLLLFGQITKESKPESPLKVSQSTLAEMVGTTRARVNKFMNAFKKKGLVSNNGGLQVNEALVIAFLQTRPMSVKKTQVHAYRTGSQLSK
ncbi:MAG: helix-turn-helix domain-containing protein [Candidatus Acidiferrales bacterium]